MGVLSGPILFNYNMCLKYKERLISFYFSNMRLCSYLDGFSYKDAEQKICGLIQHVSDNAAIVYGVFDDDELVGFVWAYEHPYREEKRVYVSEIHVDESYRKRGIGKQLLSAVECLAKERGYGALYIHAESNNEGAISLYQKEGYVIERVQLRKEI